MASAKPPNDRGIGRRFVIAAAATYVNLSAAETRDVPPTETTRTSTLPAIPAGLRTTIFVAERLRMRAAAVPNRTDVAVVRFVPAIA